MPAPTGFGELLRQHRLQLDLTQEALAERAGLALRSVQALERGESRPRRDTTERLVHALALDDRPRAEFQSLAQPAPRRRLTDAHAVATSTTDRQPTDGPRSPKGHPNNLPLQLTSFVGREREIAQVRHLLSAHRLVTLTGTGGCGKTRLACRVAESVLDDHPDGVWLVELAPLADPGLVAQTTAKALGLSDQGIQPIQTVLISYLKTKHLLLILDNCEHLIDACADLVNSLLHAAPSLRVLTTSRELLGVTGESSYRVPSLSVPEPVELPPLERLSRYESVRLLTERALLVSPEFALTEHNAAAVAQVCQRLDGIPLAIELAAAKLAVLSVEQVAARLTDRFQFLTGGSRTALRRQQTLRAAIDWSYDLLSEGERMLFRRLAVFAGGWTLETAEQVCTGKGIEEREVLDLLTGLVDKSLAIADTREIVARYRLLETVREYAGEKLEEVGETGYVRDRHLTWCLALGETGERELAGPQQVAWHRRLQAEHDNLRAGLAWSQATEGTAEAALRLASALGIFWRLHGYTSEGLNWVMGALARREGAPTWAVACALAWASDQNRLAGNRHLALALAEEAVALARQAGDQRVLAIALRNLAASTPEPAEFRARLEGSLAAGRQARDARSIVQALTLLGLADEALEVARQYWHKEGIAFALGTLSVEAFRSGDLVRARHLAEEALEQQQALGLPLRLAEALLDLGLVVAAEGDGMAARQLLRRALSLFERVGDPSQATITLELLARLDAAEGVNARAVRLLGAVAIQLPPEPALRRGQPPFDARTDRDLVALRAALGPEQFAAAWAAGQALSLSEAAAEAME